jgi:hypothetical protein
MKASEFASTAGSAGYPNAPRIYEHDLLETQDYKLGNSTFACMPSLVLLNFRGSD